jgi:hypothetical protein
MQPPAQEIQARDLHDNVWTFRHIYRGKQFQHSGNHSCKMDCVYINILIYNCCDSVLHMVSAFWKPFLQ